MNNMDSKIITEVADGIFSSVLDQTRTDFKKESAQPAVILDSVYTSIGDLIDTNDMEDWLELYAKDSFVNAACNVIANTIADLEYRFIKQERDTEGNVVDEHEIKSHPLLELLYEPNPQCSKYELLEALSVYLDLVGTGYWEIVYDQKDVPYELYNIRPSRLKPETDKNNRLIDRYVFQLAKHKKREYFVPEEIVRFIYFNPLNDWIGQGSVQAAKDEILLNQQMLQWAIDFFKKGTIEGTIETDRPINPKDIQEVSRMWNEARLRDGRSGVPVLGKGLTFNSIGSTPQEVDFLKGMREVQKAILAVLGVPPTMVGILDDAQYDNFSLQKANFHKKTVIPRSQKIAQSITKNLVPRFPKLAEKMDKDATISYIIKFDTRQLEQVDAARESKRLCEEIRCAKITPKRANDLMGYSEGTDAPDEYYIDKRLVPVEIQNKLEEKELKDDQKDRNLEDIDRIDGDGPDLDNKKREQKV